MKQSLALASSLSALLLILSACSANTPAPTPTPTATTPSGITPTLPLTTGAVTTAAVSAPTNQIVTPTTGLTPTTGVTPTNPTTIITPTGITPAQIITAPNATATIMQIISSTPQLQQLAVILDTSGMAQALQAPGAYTLFAPTDQAFAAVPLDQLTATLNNADALTNLVKYHVVVDQVTAAELASLGVALGSTGQPITITVQADSSLTANTARIVQGDILASNGIIHVIDQVLTPPSQ